MEENKDDVVVFQDNSMSSIEAQERANIDVMISVARKFPRNLKRSVDNAIAIVTMDEEAAKSCSYALPRKDKDGSVKTITGASVHLARILAQALGNIRVESRVKEITPTQIISEATCIDLENNYGVRVEVRRSIIGKFGRFNDDMVTVTGNATNAIAYRNAVYAIVPKSITDNVMKAAKNKLTGDLTTEQRVIAKRNEIVENFKNIYGATEQEILDLCEKPTITAIGRDEIVFLIGIEQALKDGDAQPNFIFGRDTSVKRTADKLKSLADEGNKTITEKRKQQQEQKQSQTGEPPKTGKPGRPAKPDGNINFEPK